MARLTETIVIDDEKRRILLSLDVEYDWPFSENETVTGFAGIAWFGDSGARILENDDDPRGNEAMRKYIAAFYSEEIREEIVAMREARRWDAE